MDLDHVVCCCAGSARYNLVAAVKSKTNVMAAILPGKFDDGDFDAWLREFDACSAANGWQVTEDKDDKILKLPAFLRGRAASNFYAIPEGERRTYKDAVKSMRWALCPQAKRENFFAEFEQRHLRPEEDPSVYKWELENILTKADPSLSNDAKTALLTRQFSKGLPPTIKLKMLEHNPTPSLDEMVEFTQRFRALCCPTVTEPRPVHVDAVSSSPSDPQLKELFTMVAGIAAKQQALEDRLKNTEHSARASSRPSPSGSCYTCGLPGHFSRECTRRPRSFVPRRNVNCYNCGKPGHIARECRSTRPLNF